MVLRSEGGSSVIIIIIIIIIIINILFVPQYKTRQYHKLQINLESAVYSVKWKTIEKVEWELFNGSDSSPSLYTCGIIR